MNQMLKTCDHITDQVRSEVTIEYVKCRADKIGVTLPNACRGWTWFWTSCDKALIDENPSLWVTHDGFYHGIDSACFAHTFERQQQTIQREIVKMHEKGVNITDGILSLFDEIFTLRIEHAAYFSSIEFGIQNITSVVISVAADMLKVRHTSEQVAREIISISNNMGEISNDTTFIRYGVGKATVELATMLGVVDDLQKGLEVLEKSRPFLTYISDTFAMLWWLWGTFSSLWHRYFSMFQNTYIAVSILIPVVWIWLFYIHGLMNKLFPIIILGVLEQFLSKYFKHIPLYIVIPECATFIFVLVVVYRILSITYIRRRYNSRKPKLEQIRNVNYDGTVYDSMDMEY
jgi:hypothetical protein